MLQEGADDCVISGLTVYNNYGTAVEMCIRDSIDSVLFIVAAAQEPDGYLYTSRTMNPKHPHEWAGSKRWEKVEAVSYTHLDVYKRQVLKR